MIFKIFENGNEVNTIVSNEAFAAAYCKKHGYTFEAVSEPKPELDPAPTVEDRMVALEADNKRLTSKLDAAIQSNQMLEDCLVEMAEIVYA